MAKKPSPQKKTPTDRLEREREDQKPLVRINFLLMAAAAAVIIIGFLLMCGPGSTDTEFNPDIFSARRIVVGPTVAFLGFIFMGVGIMWPAKRKEDNKPSDNNDKAE